MNSPGAGFRNVENPDKSVLNRKRRSEDSQSAAQSGLPPYREQARRGAASAARFRYRFRQMITVFMPAHVTPDWGKDLIVDMACNDLFEQADVSPGEMMAVNGWWDALRFGIYRKGRLLPANERIQPGDRFMVNYQNTWERTKDVTHGLAAFIFFPGPRAIASSYGRLTPAEISRALTPDQLNGERNGLLDWSAPVCLHLPASLIQMDNLYSKRWNLFWQFAVPAQGDRTPPAALRQEFPSWLDVPCFPLLLSGFTDPGRQNFGHFDFDDIPRFPVLYLDYWRLTKDPHALAMARRGLEGILQYVRSDGAMPLAVYPWKKEKTFDRDWLKWTVPHSMRAVARGVGVWKSRDSGFDAQLESAYRRFRDFVLNNRTKDGLFLGHLWSVGFVIDALWHHYQATRSAQDLADIRPLADAMRRATPEPQRRQEFAENLPVIVLGLTKAYRATKDVQYRDAALSWLEYPLLPSLKRARRFWQGLPNFQQTTNGPDGVPNALCVWYIAEALIELHQATGDDDYLSLASWELGDYFDPRYTWSQRIISTGNTTTEHWGCDHAEDAMRAFSKYLWGLQYPGRIANAYVEPAAMPPLGGNNKPDAPG